jgi:hypothetical protein
MILGTTGSVDFIVKPRFSALQIGLISLDLTIKFLQMANHRPFRSITTTFLSVLVFFGIIRLIVFTDKSSRNFYSLSLLLLVVASLGLAIMIIRSMKARSK